MDAENPVTSSPITHARMATGSTLHVSSIRCTQCSAGQKEKGRNLVVCIDGTSNQFGDHNTNVVKLFSKIDMTSTLREQHSYYSSGIGTAPKSSNDRNRMGGGILDKLDMAIAWNIEESVKETYSWLARMYQEGDQIYLFGFSRGAYQVRVLASMIHEVGLIRTPTEKQIIRAYDHYEAIHSENAEARPMARKFKSIFSWTGVRAHFVGVWDTVSSVGLVRRNNFLSASSSAQQACHFRHALALDELRVKFMPEYLHEVNAQTDDKGYLASKRRGSTISTKETLLSKGNENKAADIKEVWFAGSHSDVGGLDRSGVYHHAGNVSLLWMRREAAAGGLVLQPTDIVWVPDDIDLGISDSMTRVWQLMEYMPITHQVSFSGSGDIARRLHRFQPRRIIPGQKVHASILFANGYYPRASLGEGFDIPIVHSVQDTESDSQFWETRLFDDTAAQQLMEHLGDRQGFPLIYLDKLLFILRFEEGKQCVRNVQGWQDRFASLMHDHSRVPFIRLGATVAYCEASCDPDIKLSQETLDNAKENLRAILAAKNDRDGSRVAALLRPLTKHPILRETILSKDILEALIQFLDTVIHQSGADSSQAMDGLACLLEYGNTRETIIQWLRDTSSNVNRLYQILEIKDHLPAALHMVMTLARFPEARDVCSVVKHKLGELAKKDKRIVGLLSVEILLALYDPMEPVHLNIHNANVRANLAGALARLIQGKGDSANEKGRSMDPGQVIFRRLFDVDAEVLTGRSKMFIGELKRAVREGDARERTAATLTVLKLCETEIIREFLCEIGLLGVLIDQLKRKDSALIAAHALATCLGYTDMRDRVKDNKHLPKNIVNMLGHDYFDDAIGQVEGFQIFEKLMQHDELQKKIKKSAIIEVLNTKLAKGTPKDIRMSLDILGSFDNKDGSLTEELVEKSLGHLKKSNWKAQKKGVAILFALSHSEYGMAAIDRRIHEIIGMLLPENYERIQPTAPIPSEAQTQPAMSQESANLHSPSMDAVFRSPSWMMGPACALRILAQNGKCHVVPFDDGKLRDTMRDKPQYDTLKYLYLSTMLINDTDTSPWRVNTPNRADVVNMLDKMIKAIDEKQEVEGFVSIGNAVLPHIKHWDLLGELLLDNIGVAVGVITILPPLLSVSALAVLGAAVYAPVHLFVQATTFFKKLMARNRDSQMFENLRHRVFIPTSKAALAREDTGCPDSATGEHGGKGASGSHDDNLSRSQGIETVGFQVGGDVATTAGVASL